MSRKMRIFLVLLTCINLAILIISTGLSGNRRAAEKFDITSEVFAAGNSSGSGDNIRRTPEVVAAEKVSPAVVTIGAIRTSYVKRYDPFFNDFFSPFIVYPYKEKLPYLGSGFIINSDGYVLTSYHVIEGAEKILVTLVDGREFEAEVLDADTVVDIAMLRIKGGTKFPSVKLGDSDDIMIGETVLGFGNPFGNLIEDPQPSVTRGVVSALKRSFNPDKNNMRVYSNMIQTDASINPGNSGGPLVNLNGEVIGVNTFIMSKSGGSHGIGFAIPINRARSIAKEIVKHGRIRPLWRDFSCVNLTPYLARILKYKGKKGVVVQRMEAKGPAQKCGLKVGDLILRANDRNINECSVLLAYFSSLQVGDIFKMEIFREGKIYKMEYHIEEFKKK
jgi:serine protease Do